MLAAKLLSSVAADEKLYVDDVFQAYTRTGTGTDVTVTTGIDMTKGYMLWSKGRSEATDHAIYDSARGVTLDLVSNSTAAQTTQTTGLKSVSATGHTVGSLAKMNTNLATYVDFVFRKAPKFFDVVTYAGDGVAGRTVAHSLGIKPGMIITKLLAASSWAVYHQSLGATKSGFLEMSEAFDTHIAYWNNVEPTPTEFTVGTYTGTNLSGQTYVAYLFAHDTDTTDGIIQCGSYTGNGLATGPAVTLGWEPQYLLVKNASGTGNWNIVDSMRGFTTETAGGDETLVANSASALDVGNTVCPTATGFRLETDNSYWNASGQTYIYMAIRRPNKPPTVGTQVFSTAVSTNDTLPIATGFPVDMFILLERSAGAGFIFDRLRGAGRNLYTFGTNAESSNACPNQFDGMAYTIPNMWGSPNPVVVNAFKRAPGVFDIVAYTGTGVAHTEAHNLGVVPELIIVRKRDGLGNWSVYNISTGPTKYMILNNTQGALIDDQFNDTSPTSTVFSVSSADNVNTSGKKYVAYLFASKAGISKVTSFVGNGTTKNIDCGFTTGARFVLIRATSTTGNWNIGDSARGIIAGSDPFLRLNAQTAEGTSDDWLDPYAQGFTVNETASAHANTDGVTYLVLAIA